MIRGPACVPALWVAACGSVSAPTTPASPERPAEEAPSAATPAEPLGFPLADADLTRMRGTLSGSPGRLEVSPCPGEGPPDARLVLRGLSDDVARGTDLAEGAYVELRGRRVPGGFAVAHLDVLETEGLGCATKADGWTLSARGNEPFWRIDVHVDHLVLTEPHREAPARVQVAAPTRTPEGGQRWTATLDGLPLELTVTPGPCTDTMSGTRLPAHAAVRFGPVTGEGCGRPAPPAPR